MKKLMAGAQNQDHGSLETTSQCISIIIYELVNLGAGLLSSSSDPITACHVSSSDSAR